MHALYLVIPALCVGVIAYRFYSAFVAAKVLSLNDSRQTPAHAKYDGANYYPTPRWVLFGHHFAAITGAGPLLGPVLATQFGWAPGFMPAIDGAGTGASSRKHHNQDESCTLQSQGLQGSFHNDTSGLLARPCL